MVDSFDWNLFDSSTPSRRSEMLAVEYLRQAYGKQSPLSIFNKGNSDGIDFEIRLSGHLIGLGEVKADLNPVRQSLMSEMQKRKLYRVVLPPGSGAWTVKLLPRAKVRNLEGTLRSLVAALNAKQRTALSINDCSDEEQ